MPVDQRAERQSAPEGRGHVGDGDVPVTGTLRPAPLLQSPDGGHAPAAGSVRRSRRDERDNTAGLSGRTDCGAAAASGFLLLPATGAPTGAAGVGSSVITLINTHC